MAISLGYATLDLLVILVAAIVGLYAYFQWAFKYWARKNIPYVRPRFPFGTMGEMIRQTKAFGEQCAQSYNEFKARGHKHVGQFVFSTPMYMPIDIQYIKNIFTYDFDHFVDRGVYYNERDDPLSAHLFSVEGMKWRNLRIKFTSTFTSSKMRMMFNTLLVCGNQLKELVDNISSRKEPVDIKDVVARFTTDVIGSCAFGLDCNTCKEPDSKFRTYGKRMLAWTTYEQIRNSFAFSSPTLGRLLKIPLHPRDASGFFMNVIKDTVEYREKNNLVRNDFMQLLIKLKNNMDTEERQESGLTMQELAAQAFVFFVAGFETSSTTMTFCLFELASNPNIQQKAREEINTVLKKYAGQITYDALAEMKYLGQVIDETLRKYPPLPVLLRVCVKDYKIPGTDCIIEKGTRLMIPVLGLQHDEDYFPNPETFDPERFNEENKKKIPRFAYLPFGEGPRICIGLRFGLMQTKVGLALLLKNYIFSLNEKTKTPLEMDPASFFMSARGDIWLNAQNV